MSVEQSKELWGLCAKRSKDHDTVEPANRCRSLLYLPVGYSEDHLSRSKDLGRRSEERGPGFAPQRTFGTMLVRKEASKGIFLKNFTAVGPVARLAPPPKRFANKISRYVTSRSVMLHTQYSLCIISYIIA